MFILYHFRRGLAIAVLTCPETRGAVSSPHATVKSRNIKKPRSPRGIRAGSAASSFHPRSAAMPSSSDSTSYMAAASSLRTTSRTSVIL